MHYAAAIAFALSLAAPAGAATIVLDFEEEPKDGRFEFVSVECDCVLLYEAGHFIDDRETWLRALDVPGVTDGQGIYVGHEGGSHEGLAMEFLVPVIALSLDFGYDWEDVSPVYDASLKAYDAEDNVLAQSFVTPNLDVIVNQTISVASATPISRAVFQLILFGDSTEYSAIVDNLVLTTVPEPGTLGLAALACCWLLGQVRRKA